MFCDDTHSELWPAGAVWQQEQIKCSNASRSLDIALFTAKGYYFHQIETYKQTAKKQEGGGRKWTDNAITSTMILLYTICFTFLLSLQSSELCNKMPTGT